MKIMRQVLGQVRWQVMKQVYDQVVEQVWYQVTGQVYDQVVEQVWYQVTGQVWGIRSNPKFSTRQYTEVLGTLT
jgi:hypothetical protein